MGRFGKKTGRFGKKSGIFLIFLCYDNSMEMDNPPKNDISSVIEQNITA